MTHLEGGAYFKGRNLNLRRENIDFRGRRFIMMPVHMHVIFNMADSSYYCPCIYFACSLMCVFLDVVAYLYVFTLCFNAFNSVT